MGGVDAVSNSTDPADSIHITVEDPVQPKERLELARLRERLKLCEVHAREMERLALSGAALRDLLGTLDAPNITANPEWLRGAAKPGHTTGTGVLFISDVHWDEIVEASQVGGYNQYNHEIAERRLKNTFRNCIRLLKGHMASPNYQGLVCVLGGDIFSGTIHDELRETNEVPILVSLSTIEPVLIEGIGGLADEFGKVHVPCVTGNHGRLHVKPRYKNRAFENFEWSLYMRLASHFKSDSRITFDIPEGPDTTFTIFRKKFLLTHGDSFSGGGGIGGVIVPILRGTAKKLWREQAIGSAFDILMCGHWHTLIQLESLIVNGSIKGMDELAYARGYSPERPQQALFVVHPEMGITARWPILVDIEV